MNTQYEVVIGLEVHCQLKTTTKVWCSCDSDYDYKAPNTATCPICSGQPGALPKLNENVLNYAIKAGLALGCKINKESQFDRKKLFLSRFTKKLSNNTIFQAICGEWKIRN